MKWLSKNPKCNKFNHFHTKSTSVRAKSTQNSAVQKKLEKQKANGSWIYPNKNAILRSSTNYNQYQTYKTMAELVEFYGLNKQHKAIRNAADYLFSFQTEEGEFRGMYGNQYSPNYNASICEFLIKAGYYDERIEKSLKWLLSMRQDDGGWAIPLRTKKEKLDGP